MGGLFGGGGGGGGYTEYAQPTYVMREAPQPTPVYMPQDTSSENDNAMLDAQENQRRLRRLYASGLDSNRISGAWMQDLGSYKPASFGGV